MVVAVSVSLFIIDFLCVWSLFLGVTGVYKLLSLSCSISK